MNIRQKNLAKEMRDYILVSYIIDGETWLHYLEGLSVSYPSDITFGRLYGGLKTECILGMIFVTWCIVKLYCYVTLFSACHILIVANDISHLGIKMISWRWVVGNVTNTSEFSHHI